MLDKKSIQIMNYLINEEEISLTKLMSKTALSKKQILYALDHINSFLLENDKAALSIFKENIILTSENKQFFIDCFINNTLFTDYLLDADERIKYIFFLIFNKPSDYLSISDFLVSLKVSKSTVISDIKRLQKKIKPSDIKIKNDRNVGYYLSGDENQIRYLAMYYILEDLASDFGTFFYDYFFFNESIDVLKQIYETFIAFSKKYDFTFTDRQLTEIVYTLSLFLNRLKSNSSDDDNYKYKALEISKEFKLSKDILNQFLPDTNKEAIGFLTSWILTFTTVHIGEDAFDRKIVLELVNKVIKRFELLSGIEFYNMKEVENNLYSHFRAVHYRMIYKIPILNQFSSRIKSQYPNLFKIVGLALKEIEDCYDFPIPEEEIAYLTLHFAVAIEDYGIKDDGKLVAAVVCQNGIGSSALVFQQLKLLFPDFRFLGPYDKNSLLVEPSKIDMIFSTESNLDLFSLAKEVFVVNPVMTSEERYNLLRKVYSKFGINKVRLPRVTDLVTIINKNTEIKDTKQLEQELYTYLLTPNDKRIIDCNKIVEPNLSDLLEIKFIQTNVEISDYEEGIRKAAKPLLQSGIIQNQYLEKLIDDYHKGVIMRLTSLFCMPHATDTGGNNLGMSLVVLKHPFIFKDKSSVKYILLLSAPKSSVHLLAMNQLLKLLGQENFYEALDNFSPKDIYHYILENQ